MMKRQVELRQRNITDESYLPGLPQLLQRIYQSRGVRNEQECLLELTGLLPASTLLNVGHAAELLYEALKSHQKIIVVGDFDADGATATVVAIRGLKMLGADRVEYLVPNRFKYGYGLTPEIVEEASKHTPDLLITVDNGISSVEGVRAAKQRGCQVLITDHHLPGHELPEADVIVNPNQKGDQFASKSLAGVGVIFYVLAALRKKLDENGWFEKHGIPRPNLAILLDLVALGTVADVVPLDRNNRILVEQGLKRIRSGQCVPGISALIRESGREQKNLDAGDLGFAVAPRLNAAGRIEDMSIGIECLLTDDYVTAQEYARRLDAINQERRAIEDEMKQSALEHVNLLLHGLSKDDLPYAICLYDESWHQGVIGILASRIKEILHRPVIAFAPDGDGALKGSARSIPGLHIRDALDVLATQRPDLLTRFGGHAMAAGLSVETRHLSAFRQVFETIVKQLVDEDSLTSVIWTDGELDHQEINLDTARLIKHSSPWGQGFPEPVFEGDFVVLDRKVVGEKHIKLKLKALQAEETLEGIQFFYDEEDWPEICDTYHLAYRLNVNEFRGVESAQLNIVYVSALN